MSECQNETELGVRVSSQPQFFMQNKECFCFFFFFSILSLNTLVKQAGHKTTQIVTSQTCMGRMIHIHYTCI